MKKIFAILLALVFVFAGCTQNEPAEEPETQSESSEISEVSSEPEKLPEETSSEQAEELEPEPEQQEESEEPEEPDYSAFYIEVEIPEGEEKNTTDLYLESRTNYELRDEFIWYVTGQFMYNTWDDPYVFSPDNYMFFFECFGMDEEFFDMLDREYRDKGMEVTMIYEFTEKEVEDFVLSYYSVDSEFLRKGKNYDSVKKTYAFSTEHGFGGGLPPHPEKIVRLENGIYMFYLEHYPSNDSEDRFELKIQIKENLSYRYISNKYIPGNNN